MSLSRSPHIGIIGLGYVGLPLAVAFGKHFPCIGYDVNPERIEALNLGIDNSKEVSREDLQANDSQLQLSNNSEELSRCNVYIVTVPTPIDDSKQPNLAPLKDASALIGQFIQSGDIVIYESTVFPGCTEEVCLPIIERTSGLKLNLDFFAGYSPERINPGDKARQIDTIIKVTSGSTPEAADYIDKLYKRIVKAGTHKASSIQVAEAAKVIENTQRDVNIGLINEFSIIFKHLGIDTEEVLKAASTKWNFLPFKPGLVGGHCIGVDPYYLVHRAEKAGFHPEIIGASRRVNDKMGQRVALELMQLMTQKRIHIVDANILILGLAFKENCADLRNTGVADIVSELRRCNANIDIYDPWVNPEEAELHTGLRTIDTPKQQHYDALVLAVGHDQFTQWPQEKFLELVQKQHVIYDLKYLLPNDIVDGRL